MTLEKIINAKNPLSTFINSLPQCSHIQEATLFEIINRNSKTKFGTKYNFSTIRTIEDFQRQVPITHWEDYQDFIPEILQGKNNILFNEPVKCFIQTSGTTGAMKKIPESVTGNNAKQLTTQLRLGILFNTFPDLQGTKYLPLINSAKLATTPTGIPIGTASGFTVANLSATLRKLIAYPLEIIEEENQEILDYLIMRFALEEDVKMIAVNNAGRIESLFSTAQHYHQEIINDIEHGTINPQFNLSSSLRKSLGPILKKNPQRAAELRERSTTNFRPVDFWPNLQIIYTWLSSSVGRYISRIENYLNDYPTPVQFWDSGYGASEVKVNIPLSKNSAAGALATFGAFFEFIPTDPQEGTEPLLAHQLQPGHQYQLIVTTYSGLYRYDMKDIIQVDSFEGTTPLITFISKTADIGNICGEKLPAALITESVLHFFSNLKYYCAVADSEKKQYVIYLEGTADLPPLTTELEKKVDQFMQEKSHIYFTFRNQNLLQQIRLKKLPQGSYNKLIENKIKQGVGANQIKLPTIYNNNQLKEILKLKE